MELKTNDKITIKQTQLSEWSLYNKSQTSEIELFDTYLLDLVNTVENKEN
ncbi:hypothetical protein [Methanolapillus africanus]